MQKDAIGRVLGKQLLRSGTSIGANIHEAQGGQSKADFIAKLSIARKESLETAYWIELMRRAGFADSKHLSDLADETGQLVRIISKILITSKKGRNT